MNKISDINDLDLSKSLNKFCFSQRAEDYLVNLIFRNEKGTFIDIGANDGTFLKFLDRRKAIAALGTK